jgi:hypothetical protein
LNIIHSTKRCSRLYFSTLRFGGAILKIRFLVGVLALGAIASCTKSNTTVLESVNAKIFVQARATAERNVGKTFWLATDLLVCDKPTLITETKCEVVDRNTRLEVDGVEQGFNEENGVRHSSGMAYYHVKAANGRTGYVLDSSFDRAATTVDLEKIAAECKRRGDPRVGMSARQVVATCWGEPDHIDRRETARGITERYVYEKGRVLLHNGIVTSVQTSGILR